MAQDPNDYTQPNSNGASYRAGKNVAAQAAQTQNSGASNPTATYPFQRIARTDLGVIQRRNAADTADIIDGTLAEVLVQSKGAGYTIVKSDHLTEIQCTAPFTMQTDLAATLGDGFMCYIKNFSGGLITIDPNAAETIDGAATKIMNDGDGLILKCNGTTFSTIGSLSNIPATGVLTNTTNFLRILTASETSSQLAFNKLDLESVGRNGVTGGQTIIGGTAASENLLLQSTSNATKGYIHSDSSLKIGGDNTVIPTSPITLVGTSGNLSRINTINYQNGLVSGGLQSYKSRGTEATPTSVLTNDQLLYISANGYYGAGQGRGFTMRARATENFATGSYGTSVTFATTPNGSTTNTDALTLDQDQSAIFSAGGSFVGNVGIGTTSPKSILHASAATDTVGQGISVGSNTQSWGAIRTAATGTGSMVFDTWSGTAWNANVMSLNTSGKVLIGSAVDSDTGTGSGVGTHNLQSNGFIKHKAGWRDNIISFTAGQGGAVAPTWANMGNNIFNYRFAVGDTMHLNFHVDHDYLPGSVAYPHIHFTPTTSMIAGQTVVWTMTYIVARGHSQGDSLTGATTTITLTYTATGTEVAGEHIVIESSLAQAFSLIEPDTCVSFSIQRATGTYGSNVFGLFCDLHYQSDREVTLNKAPNFYL